MESFHNGQGHSIGKPLKWEIKYEVFEELSEEFKFLNTEFKFLHNLMGNYLIWLGKDAELHQIRNLIKHLNDLEKECKELSNRITVYLIALEEHSNGFYIGEVSELKQQKDTIISDVYSFKKQYRKLKTNLFKISKSLPNL